MNIKIKKLNKEAVIPHKVHDYDACYDLVAISSDTTKKEDYAYIEYGTGLAMEIPEGYCGLIFPRSSISKTGCFLANSVGVVDAPYRGEVKIRMKYIPGTEYYKPMDRVAQMMIVPTMQLEFEEVEDLTDTMRGEGGFGSTDVIVEQVKENND